MKTTISDKATPCPLDKVNRQFAADRPNKLWVSDFTYVVTWSGFVYVRSSSTSMPDGSWAGGPAAPLRRALSPTRFDLWANRWRRREATGDMIIVRFADDFIVGFEHENDARRFLEAMRERLHLAVIAGRAAKAHLAV
jgi:hypothetical protein